MKTVNSVSVAADESAAGDSAADASSSYTFIDYLVFNSTID
jgi:hypothetical protein